MGDIIRFPIRPIRLVPFITADPPPVRTPTMDKIVAVIWGVTVFCWTFMRFIIPLIVFWQFLRMMWFWDTPGVHAGWNFLAYFAGYTALYYFVAFYRPRFMRDRDAGGRNGRQ